MGHSSHHYSIPNFPTSVHITSGTGQNPKWNQKQIYPPIPHKFGMWGWEGRVEQGYLGMIFVRDPSQRPPPLKKKKKEKKKKKKKKKGARSFWEKETRNSFFKVSCF